MSKMRVAITGGSGFLGTNLIRRFNDLGYTVLNVDSSPNPFVDVDTRICDMRKGEFDWIDEFQPQVLIHLAGLSNHRLCANYRDAFDVNVGVTSNLLSCLKGKSIRRIIYMSTVGLYTEDAPVPVPETAPLDIRHNNYTFTKGLAERVCDYLSANEKLPILTFRLSNIYGPYQNWEKEPNLIPQICVQALRYKRIVIWNRTPVRDWIYVDDAVDAILAGIESDYVGTLNLGTGIGTSVGEIVERTAGLTNVEVEHLNQPVTGPNRVVCDTTKLNTHLGFSCAVSLDEGLKRTLDFYRSVV